MSQVQISMRGTPGYLAPEWRQPLGRITKKADQDRVIDIVENLDAYKQSEREEITRMIKVAAWCLQDDPERRPLMSTVLKVLEGVMEVDSNLVYRFSHAMISSPAGNHHSFFSTASSICSFQS
ncbi:hypothetical protein OIU74_002965 [Salix koriyanagi]|uniref:Uncharacterized protein n=1 Tax=Salix koriyanagi TaxID=2511006 RepID=A0A9Q0ZKG0_9ROSI|nr:hypothetical protein OIU74_002965 [Salix koriyanagi]